MSEVAFFIAGMAAGIAVYRFLITSYLGRPIRTTCDYCQYRIEKER